MNNIIDFRIVFDDDTMILPENIKNISRGIGECWWINENILLDDDVKYRIDRYSGYSDNSGRDIFERDILKLYDREGTVILSYGKWMVEVNYKDDDKLVHPYETFNLDEVYCISNIVGFKKL